jgi:hypothetical protein
MTALHQKSLSGPEASTASAASTALSAAGHNSDKQFGSTMSSSTHCRRLGIHVINRKVGRTEMLTMKKDRIKAAVGCGGVTIMVVSFISYLAGGLIIGSYAKSVNPETDQDRVQKYHREPRCKTKYLEQCRFRNPMNNDCGANAIQYTWCMRGDES